MPRWVCFASTCRIHPSLNRIRPFNTITLDLILIQYSSNFDKIFGKGKKNGDTSSKDKDADKEKEKSKKKDEGAKKE